MFRLCACTAVGVTVGLILLAGMSCLAFQFADLSKFEHF